MQAVRYHERGEPSVLQLEDVERPEPAPSEIVVSIRAASVNATDAKRRANGIGPLPKTTGSDFAGVIEAVGENVDRYECGDRVCGTGLHTNRFQQGSFAEYVAAPTDIVAPLPDGVSFEQGAAVALVGVTAWRAIVDHAALEPTETCLVHGGTGGVGHIAVQLASLLRATVVATAGSVDSRRAAERFGADAVFDYARDDLLDVVTARAERGYDVILDHCVHDYFTFDLEAAAFDARIVHYGGVHGTVENSPAGLQKSVTIQVMTMSNLATRESFPSVSSVLGPVLGLVDRGAIEAEIARTYGLEDAADAHRDLMEDSFVGKLLVLPDR